VRIGSLNSVRRRDDKHKHPGRSQFNLTSADVRKKLHCLPRRTSERMSKLILILKMAEAIGYCRPRNPAVYLRCRSRISSVPHALRVSANP